MLTDKRASQLFVLLDEGVPVSRIARRLRMSEKTARKYRDIARLPSQMERPERSYRTRPDPLESYWDEIVTLLEGDRQLKPYAILDWLKQKYNRPDDEQPRITDAIRRTLERRVQQWKLEQGVEQEVKFPQVHHPGDVVAFDFVDMNTLKITIAGRPFDHLLFHGVFTYSNWEYTHLCHSESFEALSAGLQDTLYVAGGVPRRVRSDSLSAAVNNLSSDKEFAKQYRDLLQHLGAKGHRINVRKPHENGDVESSHGHFKDALDQALRLRGSRDFLTAEEYMGFVRQLVGRRNAARESRFREEREALSAVPARRLPTSTSQQVTVKSDSVIRVKRNVYSLSSKYIGLKLEVRIHQDHLELWYRNECVERLPRQFGQGKETIDFRHVIDSLVRKPGAFINYNYVHHLYPTTRFRMAYDQLLKHTTESAAVKQYLRLLYAAKHEGLDLVDDTLRWFMATGKAIRVEEILEVVAAKQQLPEPAEVSVGIPDLSQFDSLLQHKDVYDGQDQDQLQSLDVSGNEDDRQALATYDRHLTTSGATQGTSVADVSGEPFDDRRASGTRPLDAHALPGGTGRERMPVPAPESYSPFDARCQLVGWQDLGPI